MKAGCKAVDLARMEAEDRRALEDSPAIPGSRSRVDEAS